MPSHELGGSIWLIVVFLVRKMHALHISAGLGFLVTLVSFFSFIISLGYFCSYRLEMLAEASDEIVDEEEDGIKLEVEGDCNDDLGLLMDAPEMNEDKNRENSDEAQESQQAAVILTLVNILKFTFLQYLTMSKIYF